MVKFAKFQFEFILDLIGRTVLIYGEKYKKINKSFQKNILIVISHQRKICFNWFTCGWVKKCKNNNFGQFLFSATAVFRLPRPIGLDIWSEKFDARGVPWMCFLLEWLLDQYPTSQNFYENVGGNNQLKLYFKYPYKLQTYLLALLNTLLVSCLTSFIP